MSNFAHESHLIHTLNLSGRKITVYFKNKISEVNNLFKASFFRQYYIRDCVKLITFLLGRENIIEKVLTIL